jgi:regulator of RNase E activity RraA
MGLYAIRRKVAIENKRRIGLNPKMIFADPTEAIDVNFPEDFKLAETIAAGKREKDRLLLNNLKGLMSSPFLSDIFDDIGISSKQILSGLKSNINDGKLIGRAKTLKLRKLKDGEDWRGIYNALKSYKSVVTNDVIVVQNDCPDLAYFGELNANIAIRCGASGAIIGGKTRDSQKVKQLGFMTFSQGFVAKDVRKRATLENYDVNIDLFGANVQPGDLIFGDVEAVVVIPKEFEEAVINEVFVRLKNENDIVSSIAKGYDVKDLVDNYGQF